MKKLTLAYLLIASLAIACGSEVGAGSNPGQGNPGGSSGTDVTPPSGGNGGGGGQGGGGGNAADVPDSGTGGGDQDGETTDQDSGSTGDTDGGAGDQDSGSGDQDSGGGGECTPHSCVLSYGYYKIHTVDWTGPSLVLGGVSYTQQEWIALLKMVPQGDDSIILAKQLIAALLNGGACDPNAAATVQAAQDWMAANKDQDGRLPYGTMCVNQSDPGCTAWSLGQTLDAYNNGESGTPHCN